MSGSNKDDATTQGLLNPTPEVSKSLHTKVVEDQSVSSFVSRLSGKDKKLQTESVNTYEKFWKDSDGNIHNTDESRQGLYTTLVNTYYNLATDFYEYGWGESFHFARKSIGENFRESIRRHEHLLYSMAQIRPGMKVLDVGCGVGGPARECVRLTGAHVVGLNNNDYQIQRAKIYAKKYGQSENSEFIKGNFMDMPFEPNTFDAVYAIEATCHAPVLEGVYQQMYNVLKPGGRFAIYEWCLTDKFDSNNPQHCKMARDIEEGDGIPKLFSTDVCVEAVKKVGFNIEFAEDMTTYTQVGNEIPWYKDLDCGYVNFSSIQGFARSEVGRKFTTNGVALLEKVGIAPKGTVKVQEVLMTAADGLVKGAKIGIFTPMFLVVAQKPLN
ncbi:Delta(24)-sterol C-methyltransferase [Mycoemilia scoparia]|uniref:Delta(24)-sterol C-methyltransferase n=1 Tax=Mycoemilia scoparia TaxID=417184 RepID=A0A9W8DQY6_9FUNG|nr:Delta(24)-sterol C-methyltransferase [Mycoemilia scoparia]